MELAEKPEYSGKKFLLCITHDLENLVGEASKLIDLGYELFGDIWTANKLANHGLPCADFEMKDVTADRMTEFDGMFLDIIDDAGRPYPEDAIVGKQAYFKKLSAIRFESSMLILIQHKQLRNYVEWKLRNHSLDYQIQVNHKTAVNMRTRELMRSNGFLPVVSNDNTNEESG